MKYCCLTNLAKLKLYCKDNIERIAIFIMNKKGFTLVELLAVIAFLAILVIIALPNVLGMFNQAKMDTFTTETKEMVKITQQQYLATFGKYTSYAIDKSLLKGVTDESKAINAVPCTSASEASAGKYCKIDKEAGNLKSFILTFNASNGQVNTLYANDGTYEYIFDSNGGKVAFDATNVTATEIDK